MTSAPRAVPEEVTRAETKRSLLLWFGILAAPLAWTAQVLIAPDVAEVVCYTGAARGGRGEVFGVGLEVFLLALTGVLTLIALAGGLVAFGCWRRLRRTSDETPARRAMWMARAGISVTVLFLLSTAIGFIPLAFLESCEGAL